VWGAASLAALMAAPESAFGSLTGRVTEFDDPRGLGTITAGDRSYPFHCTALLDGTRTVEVGAEVTFEVAPGRLGRWEATRIERRA
jgi:cold shock CspA family protein